MTDIQTNDNVQSWLCFSVPHIIFENVGNGTWEGIFEFGQNKYFSYIAIVTYFEHNKKFIFELVKSDTDIATCFEPLNIEELHPSFVKCYREHFGSLCNKHTYLTVGHINYIINKIKDYNHLGYFNSTVELKYKPKKKYEKVLEL